MTARTLARIALVVSAPILFTAAVAAPAQAHGALDNPVSRVYACSPEGGQSARSAACKAAVAVSGAQAFVDWDNLRIPNINGRDRQLIPDGKLCSGGLPAYRGLDLPRADWPATKVSAGASFTFTYRTTIPHPGVFRMYVTKDGYDPTRPLTWSDVEAKPFLTASNPPITNGAYVMPGKLPAGKTGRHMIFTIWQTNPDTYYSCSDAVFTGPAGGGQAAPPQPAGNSSGAVVAPETRGPGTGGASEAAVPSGVPAQQPPATGAATVTVSKASSYRSALPMAAGGVAVLAVAGAAGAFLWRRRRQSS
jgi:chitin-binding protein